MQRLCWAQGLQKLNKESELFITVPIQAAGDAQVFYWWITRDPFVYLSTQSPSLVFMYISEDLVAAAEADGKASYSFFLYPKAPTPLVTHPVGHIAPCGGFLLKPHSLHKALMLKWTLSSNNQMISTLNKTKCILRLLIDRLSLDVFPSLFSSHISPWCITSFHIAVSKIFRIDSISRKWLGNTSMVIHDHDYSASGASCGFHWINFSPEASSSSETHSWNIKGEVASFGTALILYLPFIFNMSVAA